jgi:hypothetical protein
MSVKDQQNLQQIIKKYDDFISNRLKPSLKAELDQRDGIFNTLSE